MFLSKWFSGLLVAPERRQHQNDLRRFSAKFGTSGRFKQELLKNGKNGRTDPKTNHFLLRETFHMLDVYQDG